MCQIDGDSQGFHAGNKQTPEFGQSMFIYAVSRTREFVISKMSKPHHAKTCSMELI